MAHYLPMDEAEFRGPDGEPLTLREWARRFEDLESRTLLRDTFADRVLITVRLGTPPALFGTALVSTTGSFPARELATYATQPEALRGHIRNLTKLMGLNP